MRNRSDLTFSMDEYGRRLADLRVRMAQRRIDLMLAATPENITYLSGYQTTGYYYLQVLAVPLEGEPFMVTRLLEDSNVRSRTWIESDHSHPFLDTENPVARLAEAIEAHGFAGARIGYERNSYFLRATEQESLFTLLPGAVFIDVSGMVEEGRLVKSTEEIALMRRAAVATEAGMRAALETVGAGVTENVVAGELHNAMFRAGGEYPACSPFVVSGPRCSVGHATWEGRTMERGDFVFIEVGGCVQRYHTAMMRTAFVGEPSATAREAEALVQEAVAVCMEVIRPGVSGREVDAASRAVLSKNRIGAEQQTRAGYSMGIAFAPDWGEGHIYSLQPDQRRPLEENMVFHLIPFIQIPGEAAVGISETVRVTETGCESFFSIPRELFSC